MPYEKRVILDNGQRGFRKWVSNCPIFQTQKMVLLETLTRFEGIATSYNRDSALYKWDCCSLETLTRFEGIATKSLKSSIVLISLLETLTRFEGIVIEKNRLNVQTCKRSNVKLEGIVKQP